MSFLKAIASWGYSFGVSEEILVGASYCFTGVVVEVFLSLVVLIAVCSVEMASTELVWIVAGPLSLASEVEKCTSVDALDEGLISCVFV